MKKFIILAVLVFACMSGFSQYRNITINQKIHFQDDSLNSCYLVIKNVSFMNCSTLTANYIVQVYKSANSYSHNKKWTLTADEIPERITITVANNFNGDLFMKRLSVELKQYLLSINPTWVGSNFTIEN